MSHAKSTTRVKGASRKTARILLRLTPERRREIRVLCARLDLSLQAFLERGFELALAEARNGKD